MKNEIRQQVMEIISGKLRRLAIRDNELGNSFDLVKSGLLNSLEFVDLVASLERTYQLEINFDEAIGAGDFTTLGGLVRVFEVKK